MQGDREIFECIYNDYWPRLYAYVYNRLKSREAAEEILQEVFFSLWIKRAEAGVVQSLSAYLFAAVRYQVFNYIKADKVRRDYAARFAAFKVQQADHSNEQQAAYGDLSRLFEREIARLPEKCRRIFRMSRHEHRSIQDIAEALHISHKTVENQLTKALKQLRLAFREYFF